MSTETTLNPELTLPFIMDVKTTGDIEEWLEVNKENKNYRIQLKFLTEPPKDYAAYQMHEESLKFFFKRMNDRSYKVGTLVCSSRSHYALDTNRDYKWRYFLDEPMIFLPGTLNGWNLRVGDSIKYEENGDYLAQPICVPMQKYFVATMEEEKFLEVKEQIDYAGFDYYDVSRNVESTCEEVTMYIIDIPVASIIQLTLVP